MTIQRDLEPRLHAGEAVALSRAVVVDGVAQEDVEALASKAPASRGAGQRGEQAVDVVVDVVVDGVAEGSRSAGGP